VELAQKFDQSKSTFAEVLREKAERNQSKTFINNLKDGRQISYADIDEFTEKVGCGLLSAGLEFGTHVAMMMDNCPEILYSILGASRAGLVSVPVNTGAKGQLLQYFLSHADCEAVIVEQTYAARVLEVLESLPLLRLVWVLETDRSATDEERVANKEAMSQLENGGKLRVFSEFYEVSAKADYRRPAFKDIALMMYTSGTTGPSKAIMLCHAQCIYWGIDVQTHHEYTSEDIAYVYLPLFHSNALLGSTMGCLMADASIALAPRFSVSAFWDDVRNSKATVFNCLSSIVNFLWNQEKSDGDRNHGVRRVHLAPVPGFATELEDRFGVTIMSAYALTDFGLATYFNTKSRRDKLGSGGLPRHNVELRIVDENDIEVPDNSPGEIVLRHNTPWASSLGYYKAPEATANSRRNHWFHTGDRGVRDTDGYIWFTDRLKDAIRRRGENISAFEVEEVIRSFDGIEDVAVFPVRADASEEEVAASVIPKEKSDLDFAALIAHCNKNLAYFMVPRFLKVVESLPRTLTQKVEKHKLRAEGERDISAFWDREKYGVRVGR
jgi:crotonobetaine/carnitine-CoA ligase